jgi:hypothetical protein
MPTKRALLVRLTAVHALGLAALAFATPAHATDDPPLPVPPATASSVPTSEEPVYTESAPISADDAGISPVEQESPGNTPPSASATAQLDSVRQGWVQVISPTHAQKSPGRASSKVRQRSAVAAPLHERQYHPRHVQYQRHSTARSKPRGPVLATASFSFGEPARITRSSAPIGSPNPSVKVSHNCALDPHGYWSRDLPTDDAESVECATDPPADDVTSEDPSDSTDCADPAEQYQPDETQYQTPASICDPANESVVPISEPEVPVPSTSGSSDAAPPPSVVPPTTPTTPATPTAATTPPTTEPVAAPVVPDVEPAQPAADVPPAPPAAQPVTTMVATSRAINRPSRPESASRGPAAPTARVIPARVRPSTPTRPVRSRPVKAPGATPKTSVTPSRVEAAPPQSVVPASAHGNLLGGWLLLVLPLSFVVALALLFPAGALVGRSLRARVGSKGLSGDRAGSKSSAGIRYRD